MGLAWMVTLWSCSSAESLSVSAKVGACVLKRFVVTGPPSPGSSKRTRLTKRPVTCSPCEEISLTLLEVTWWRKYGLYGTVTCGFSFGRSADARALLIASAATTEAIQRQPMRRGRGARDGGMGG